MEDRLTHSGGLLDPTFGSGGIVHLPNATDSAASAVAVQPDGKTVLAGHITRSHSLTADSITVQRLNQDGSLDKTFNDTGSVTIQTGASDFPTCVALQPDGKILIGGDATSSKGSNEGLVARLNANGSLDTAFGNSRGLELLTNVGQVNGLAVLTDPANPTTITGIVAAANGSTNGTLCFEAIKLTPTGVPDKTFGAGGFSVLANLNGNQISSVAANPLNGEIYLAGTVNGTRADGSSFEDGCLAALTPAGTLDPA